MPRSPVSAAAAAARLFAADVTLQQSVRCPTLVRSLQSCRRRPPSVRRRRIKILLASFVRRPLSPLFRRPVPPGRLSSRAHHATPDESSTSQRCSPPVRPSQTSSFSSTMQTDKYPARVATRPAFSSSSSSSRPIPTTCRGVGGSPGQPGTLPSAAAAAAVNLDNVIIKIMNDELTERDGTRLKRRKAEESRRPLFHGEREERRLSKLDYQDY